MHQQTMHACTRIGDSRFTGADNESVRARVLRKRLVDHDGQQHPRHVVPHYLALAVSGVGKHVQNRFGKDNLAQARAD